MTDKQLERLNFALKSKTGYTPCNVVIGNGCDISGKCSIGRSGFGWARNVDGTLVKIWHHGDVTIGDDCEIRDFVTIDRATVKETSTVIGNGNKFDHHCHIAHNAKIGNHNTFAAGCYVEGSCEVGDFNTFGTGVIIQTKVKVGNNCIIGSGTVLTKDVPDNSIVAGVPGRVLKSNEVIF